MKKLSVIFIMFMLSVVSSLAYFDNFNDGVCSPEFLGGGDCSSFNLANPFVNDPIYLNETFFNSSDINTGDTFIQFYMNNSDVSSSGVYFALCDTLSPCDNVMQIYFDATSSSLSIESGAENCNNFIMDYSTISKVNINLSVSQDSITVYQDDIEVCQTPIGVLDDFEWAAIKIFPISTIGWIDNFYIDYETFAAFNETPLVSNNPPAITLNFTESVSSESIYFEMGVNETSAIKWSISTNEGIFLSGEELNNTAVNHTITGLSPLTDYFIQANFTSLGEITYIYNHVSTTEAIIPESIINGVTRTLSIMFVLIVLAVFIFMELLNFNENTLKNILMAVIAAIIVISLINV